MSTDTISPLRHRMIEDMNARKLCAGTQSGHIRSCKRFAAFLKRSPDTATAEDIRRFQLHLSETGTSICNRNRIMTGLRFLFRVTLRRLDLAAEIYHIREPEKIPLVMSPDETRRVLAVATSLKARVALSLCYGCGLHLGKGEFDGKRLIPAALMSDLQAPRIYNTSPGHAEFGEAHYGFGFQSNIYRGDRLVSHGGGWIGWGTLMTLVPDFGIGVAVFTNRSPSQVPETLTWYIIDRLRGRDPIDWRGRFRKEREEFIAHSQVDKDAREKARHKGTRPAHDLTDYAGDYEHPAYGVMSITERDGTLHWSWRGMFAPMGHRHFETFELPEVPDRLLPDRLAITFLTSRDGNIVSLSTSLEPMVKDIVFVCLPAGDCIDPAFRERCVGKFKGGTTTHRVTLDTYGKLVLKPDNQPSYRLAPHQGRRFRIVELEGFFVEFRGGGTIIDEVIFHQPNGTSVARRVDD